MKHQFNGSSTFNAENKVKSVSHETENAVVVTTNHNPYSLTRGLKNLFMHANRGWRNYTRGASPS